MTANNAGSRTWAAPPGGTVGVVASVSGGIACGAVVGVTSAVVAELSTVAGWLVDCSDGAAAEVAGPDDDEVVVAEDSALVVEALTSVVEVTAELLAVPNRVELEHADSATRAQHVVSNPATLRQWRAMYVCVFIISSHISPPGQFTVAKE